jgi:hypothetical protein
MADFFTSSYAQTVSNAGATVAKLGDNALKTVGPDGYTASSLGGARTYAGPYSRFGTRELVFLKVAVASGDNNLTKGADGVNGSYTDTNSVFSRAIRAVQGFGEIYFVSTPSSGSFAVAVAFDTQDGSEANSNVQATTYGAMEAAINSSVNASGVATVTVLDASTLLNA